MICVPLAGIQTEETQGVQQCPPWQAGISLPPELQTGHAIIDAEHTHLLSCIRDLRRICDDLAGRQHCLQCTDTRQQACENELIRHLGDLLAFILDHFRHEESIMHESLMTSLERAVCEAHMEDHAAISAKVQQIVASIDRHRLAGLMRELDVLLGTWTINHIRLHDMILVRWIEHQDLRTLVSAKPAV